MARLLFLLAALLLATSVQAAGNTANDSFSTAKKALERQVYMDHRVTLYCGASFDAQKNITLPEGFVTPSHEKRVGKVEWEHAVPAENFGRFFSEWRDGAPQCVDNRGKAFKGRKCAEKASLEYRFMQADMYNLFPAIGAVNALRSNYNYQMLGDSVPPTFGSCEMKIAGGKAEPPARARGQVARAHKYMADAYGPRFQLSRQQSQLMNAWDNMYPVDAWECTRAQRIERIQGNENTFVKQPCQAAGLWK